MTMGRAGDHGRVERVQQAHFDDIAEVYERHGDNAASQEYRRRFIDEPVTHGIRLDGAVVLEALCGPGFSAGYLQDSGADVIGLDISPTQMARFRDRWPKTKALCASALSLPLPAESTDVVLVIGGLHHLRPHEDMAISEAHRVLRPGGWLCFYEPHRGSWLDRLRRLWYRLDPMFTETEEAIDLEALHRAHHTEFEFVSERYVGSVAYVLVLNSLVLRLPARLKAALAGPAMAVEAFLDRFLGRRTACSAIGQWRKR